MRCFFLQGRGPRAWTRNEFRRGERDREGDSWLVTCWSWHQLRPVSNDHLSHVSTIRLESTGAKFSWLDMMWKGSHLSLSDSVGQTTSQEVRGTVCRPPSTDLGKGFCTWRSQRAQWPPSPTHGESLEGSAKEDGRNSPKRGVS